MTSQYTDKSIKRNNNSTVTFSHHHQPPPDVASARHHLTPSPHTTTLPTTSRNLDNARDICQTALSLELYTDDH